MSDIIIFFLFFNILILSLVFWSISIFMEYFFLKKFHKLKKQFYECGFKNLSEINLQINISYIYFIFFFILYDSEIFLLYPIIFNYINITFYQLILLFIFLFCIILSFIYDELNNSFNWII